MKSSDESGFVSVGRHGGRVAYSIYGKAHAGTPLLLIRPLGGGMALWGPFAEALSNHRRLIAYDPRGEGHSSPSRLDETTRSLARDAVDVLDHLGIDVADVFGISLGGMASQWLAIDAPSRVRKLCLASTTARGLDLLHAGARRGLEMVGSFFERGDHVEASLAARILSARFRRQHPDQVVRIARPILAAPATRFELLKHTIAGARHDAVARVHEISAPTLVLAGERDAWLGLEPQRRLASAIAGAQFDVVAGAGHDITVEEPLITAAKIERFLSSDAGPLDRGHAPRPAR